jgi:uncharacterized protein (DUF58 family)
MALTTPSSTVGSSPRLVVYAGVGAAAVVASLVTARPALVAFGAPLLLLSVVGVCLASRPSVAVESFWATPARVIAGDDLTLELRLTATPRVPRLELCVALEGPVTVTDRPSGYAAWCFNDCACEVCRAELATVDWGRVSARSATVRAYGPLGLVHWTWSVPLSSTARVLPTSERLRTLLDPPPRGAAGSHASRARGSGLDFAELRPLAPGDRLADVNWRASARRGGSPRRELLVNVRHPERTGDVVLLLDAAADDEEERAIWLPRAGQVAWAIANAHLHQHDRVGLVGFGGYTSWVTIGGGERAAYALLDKLMSIRPRTSGADRSLDWLPPRLVPAGAALIALTPLHTLATIDVLAELRRRGRRVAAVVIDTSDLLPTLAPGDATAALARRFWALELDRRIDLLSNAGVITARWQAGTAVAQAVALLARISHAAGASMTTTAAQR